MTAKHADHTLSECPDDRFCEMLVVWRITNNRTGTSHALPYDEVGFKAPPHGRVRVIPSMSFLPAELFRRHRTHWELIK